MAISKGDSMIERLSRAAGVVLCALLLSTPALAQTALGTLRGVVVDEQGAALPGVTVTVRQWNEYRPDAVTGAEGQSSAEPPAGQVSGDRRALRLRPDNSSSIPRRSGPHGQVSR